MFDLPNAKRVRRAELHSPAASTASSPDPELTALFQSTVSQRFELPEKVAPSEHSSPQPSPEEPSTFSFRLFSSKPVRPQNEQPRAVEQAGPPAPVYAQIQLDVTDDEEGEGGFTAPDRPTAYYFATPPDEASWTKLHSVAVTVETIRQWARTPWPGCRLPWKVTRVDGTSMRAAHGTSTDSRELDARGKTRRTRKGKKTRIAIRKRYQSAKDKHQEEQEKRNKRNREKKIKRREKERAKKLAASVANHAEAEGSATAAP